MRAILKVHLFPRAWTFSPGTERCRKNCGTLGLVGLQDRRASGEGGGGTVIDMPLAQKTRAGLHPRAPGTWDVWTERKTERKTARQHTKDCHRVCSISRTSGTQTNMTEDSEPLRHNSVVTRPLGKLSH